MLLEQQTIHARQINLIPDRTDDSVTVFKCKCSEDHKFINS